MKRFPIVKQSFTEHERGWGSRPDGYSLHLSVEDMKLFNKDYNEEHNNLPYVPDEYTTPDNNPEIIDVSEKVYNDLQLRKPGVRFCSKKGLEDYLNFATQGMKNFDLKLGDKVIGTISAPTRQEAMHILETQLVLGQ